MFPLSEVHLLDSPFKQAMERNAAYVLSLEPDRLLHNTRKYAGLAPKGDLYGGWEARGIAGHTLGHYLTAISQQYAATGDARFRQRIDYIVSELAECQKAYGDGYVGALPQTELATLRDLKSGKLEVTGGFDFKSGAWVPWYTQHKVLAGLLDSWALGGNEQAKGVALRLADWVDECTKNLTPQQLQAMLQVEHGGMLEALVRAYELSGNKRYLDVSRRFYHHAIFDPLLARQDKLDGKHANTQIPKIIGLARMFEATGDRDARAIAEFFWDTVVHNRTWVIGGNSDHEHFFPVGQAHAHLGPADAETCNTYNMLKLTEHLVQWQPGVELADYYERALYNHILASQEPRQGMFTYFMSLRPGHFKTYSTPFDSFWCCVGTGMENHSKYGEAIYFHCDDALHVNLFVPSELDWRQKGLLLEQRTKYPNEGHSEFQIKSAPSTSLSIFVRCPAWASGPLKAELNALPMNLEAQPGQYARLTRVWKQGDRLTITIPMSLRLERLEGAAGKIAFVYGPVVLAADLGAAPQSKSFPYAQDQGANFHAQTADVPVLVQPSDVGLLTAVDRLNDAPLAFRTRGLGRPVDVTLRPFNELFYERYNVYFDVLSESQWRAREARIAAEAEQRAGEDACIIDEFNPGEQQSEVDHHLASERSHAGEFNGRKWRDATDGGYIAFEMKVAPGQPHVLRCTYWGDDSGNRVFDILVNGQRIATQKLDHNQPGQFFDSDYRIPADVIADKTSVTIRLQGHDRAVAGGLFRSAILKDVIDAKH